MKKELKYNYELENKEEWINFIKSLNSFEFRNDK